MGLSFGKVFASIGRWIRKTNDTAAEKIDVSDSDKNRFAVEDLIENSEQAIKDSTTQVEDFRVKLRGMIASNNMMRDKLNKRTKERNKYDTFAKQKAVGAKAGDENEKNLLAQAVNKIKQLDLEITSLTTEVNTNDSQIVKLREQLDSALNKIERAESNIGIQGAKLAAANIRKEMATPSLGGLSALDALEEATQKAVYEADAAEELAHSPGQELEDLVNAADTSSLDEDMKKYIDAA